MSVPYIGCSITLISKSEIRYVGTLDKIDQEESTVTLKNVRSFGSEGRRKQPPQIPPSNQVFEYIVFRGSDIKDLHVASGKPEKSQELPDDPAIVSGSTSKAATKKSKEIDSKPKIAETKSSNSTRPSNTIIQKEVNGITENPEPRPAQTLEPKQSSRPSNRREKPSRTKITVPNTDFDFEGANAKLDKSQISQEIEKKKSSQVVDMLSSKLFNLSMNGQKYYDKKSSFFDNISSEIIDRQNAGNIDRKARIQEDKQLNIETFGETGFRGRWRGRGRGRGRSRGRGGRGRGRPRADRQEQRVNGNTNTVSASAQ